MAIVATLWRHYNHGRSVERVREVDFLQILKINMTLDFATTKLF